MSTETMMTKATTTHGATMSEEETARRLAEAEAELTRLRALRNDQAARDEATGVPAFWAEHEHRFAWDLLPLGMLHEMYEAWCAARGAVPVGRSMMTRALGRAIAGSERWDFSDSRHKLAVAERCSADEALLAKYGLEHWRGVEGFHRGPRRRVAP